jgi:hypothetical protein
MLGRGWGRSSVVRDGGNIKRASRRPDVGRDGRVNKVDNMGRGDRRSGVVWDRQVE